MNKDVVAQQARGERVLIVVDEYPADFSGEVPALAVAQIREGVAKLQALPVEQKTGQDNAMGASGLQRGLVNDMGKELRALRRTFDQAKKRDASITGDLNLPADRKEDTIVAAARTAIRLLTPLKAKFIARGKRADFLDDLNDDIAQFDALKSAQQTGNLSSVGATADIERAVHDLIEAYEDLDDYVENLWEDEPQKLAEWHRAEKLGKIRRNPGAVNPGGE